jgi:1,4-alpha-glucan branching enzyme
VIYELHIGTFNPTTTADGTFTEAIQRLDYLKELGVNAVEVMPLHENAPGPGHTPSSYDWGYDPVSLFAIKSSYGSPLDFKAFVTQAHARGIAVIVDVVYNHLVGSNLLERFGGFAPPNVRDGVYFYPDDRVMTGFGPRPDYGRPQVRSYVTDNALMWLRDYGADGLRWDSTINIRAQGDPGRPLPDGERLLRETNDAYRNTEPRQPQKIAIAEDLQSAATVDTPTSDPQGLGFNSQWDESLFSALRRAVFAVNDQDRDVTSIGAAIEKRLGPDVFNRVIFTENHDKVGHPSDSADGKPQVRLPALIDERDNESVYAKKRSTLAAAVVLTSPGIPMLFQGQELLETRVFDFNHAQKMDWTRSVTFQGIVQLYRDLIALRRNATHKTAGLTLQGVNVFRVDEAQKILAYHRYGNGGPGDDVVVVANFSNLALPHLQMSFPREGKWVVRFNSGATVYDPGFTDGDSFDTVATASDHDERGLRWTGNVGAGPYSLIILSQD